MTERSYPNLFEIVVCEIKENGIVDRVLGKAPSVLAKTNTGDPLANLVHHATAPSYLIERREQAIGFCDLRKFGTFVEANQGRNKKITGSLMLTCYLIELRE